MLEVVLSATVLRALDGLTKDEQHEFNEIQHHLAGFLSALMNAGLVAPYSYFGIEGFRYYGKGFHYLILFQKLRDPQTGDDYLYVDLLLKAA